MSKILLILFCAIAVANSSDWWEQSTFYQIFPRSFKDSDNNGNGDIKGVTSKLEYLKDIGVTAALLSPIFKSPQVDLGYDVSDYKDIDPIYGTLDDLKELITKAKKLGLKIILDLIPNHTSDQHEWFTKSVENDPEFADFYVWKEGKNNNTEPPCNWKSMYEDSAWTFNKERGLWYYHLLTENQPDLNLRNPKVIEALNDVMTYWLDFGIDGFRVNSASYLFEDDSLTDEMQMNKGYEEYNNYNHVYTKDLNETFELIYQWRKLVDKYNTEHNEDKKILITETNTTLKNTIRYYVSENNETIMGAHFNLNFNLLSLNESTEALDIKNIVDKWIKNLPIHYTQSWLTGNQNIARTASRFGQENVDAINMLQAILPGVMVTYNGEEYGMENAPVSCEDGQDAQATKDCKTYPEKSRDFERTPMQWDDTINAGFNAGFKPWLPVNPNYINNNNIKYQNTSGLNSHLNTYKALQEMRKNIPASAVTVTTVFNNNTLGITRHVENGYYLYLYNRNGEPSEVSINGKCRIISTSLNSPRKAGYFIYDDKFIMETNESIILWQGIPL